MLETGVEERVEGGDEPAVLIPSADISLTHPRLEGLVVALAPGLFEVSTANGAYLCTLRGRLRKARPAPRPRQRPATPSPATRAPRRSRDASASLMASPGEARSPIHVTSGDRVLISALPGGEGVIEDVLPRRTALARARSEAGTEQIMLANVDAAVLVFATRDPEPRFGLLDRYLALCEHATVSAVICLNKIDLGVTPELEEAVALYADLGYPVVRTSATTGVGLEELRALITSKISLLTGPSGAGKSSLTNALIPGASQRVGEISQATHKGRHTTTGVRLLATPAGGWMADSAGIRELALWNVPSTDLSRCFVELRGLEGTCLYEDCQHAANEEGCAFRTALATGVIAPQRFTSFERLLQEARATEAQERPRG
jgi:ribosome biogenesis GTPase / thiamine phosphate phosphatase